MKKLVLAALAVSIVGCGGGDSKPTPPPVEPTPPPAPEIVTIDHQSVRQAVNDTITRLEDSNPD
ncbi:hypothetical protein JCM19236_443 [Vibrio sp. JCM 19236]|nr:hypothetical protein JCM19236_443 [Vibrio sp. JCM 19236]